MFIGHLPAGYLATSGLLGLGKKISKDFRPSRHLASAGLAASVLPDIDMFYFYFLDNRQHLHHGYATHLPFFWLLVMTAWIIPAAVFRKTKILIFSAIMGINIFLHLFLDTICGKIRWLYPVSNRDYLFVEVSAKYDWWVWNFVFHRTFLLEVILLLAASTLFLCYRRGDGLTSGQNVPTP